MRKRSTALAVTRRPVRSWLPYLLFAATGVVMFTLLRTSAPSAFAALPGEPATRPGEVVERDDSGKITARYQANPKGQKNGAYQTFFPDGKIHVKGSYLADQKTGVWITYNEAGKAVETASYRADVLEGPYLWNSADSKASMKTLYRDGVVAGPVSTFDENGRPSRNIRYPRPLSNVVKAWTTLYPSELSPPKYATDPVLTPPYKAGEVSKDALEEALKVVQLYRYLSGVPFEQLRLDPSASQKAQHGAVLLAKIGSLTHTPAKPDDMDDAFFKLGYAGCNQSNLHRGQGNLVRAIRGFMDDSDASNINQVGHRQWVLAPGLQRTGFGFAKGFSAMHVVDGSRQKVNFDFIAFPGEGYYPLDLLERNTAWSTHFALGKIREPEADSLKIRIISLDERYQPGEASDAEVVSVVSDNIKGWSVVIFRPKVEKLDVGRYWVEITGLQTSRGPAPVFGYIVHLLKMSDLQQAAPDKIPAAPAGR